MSTDDLHGDGIEREHARLGLSGAEWWASCTAGPDAADGKPDNAFDRTRYGSCGHRVGEECLLDFGTDLVKFLGQKYVFWSDDETGLRGHCFDHEVTEPFAEINHEVVVSEEMLDEVAIYVQWVRDLVHTTGGKLYVELRMPIEHITKERNAKGTGDAIIADRPRRTLYVIDLKLGFKKVEAFKKMIVMGDVLSGDPGYEKFTPNLQLGGYADSALEMLDPNGTDFDEVVLAIIQPAINHISEHRFTVAEIRECAQFLRERAADTRERPTFAPSFETCMFCRARDDCKERDRSIKEELTGGFTELDGNPLRPVADEELGHVYERLAEIEQWCADKRLRVRGELTAGRPVIGRDEPYKLVAGDEGDREWGVNEAAAIEMMNKTFRLPEEVIYKKKAIGPAGAEKLTKKKRGSKEPPVIGKTQWDRLSQLIKRAPPSQSKIVLQSDPRPAISSAVEGFTDLEAASNPAADCADLFD